MEGASMTKHNGKYYLQYAAPGTQFNVYGDGVYIGETPLGPFTYMKNNPMSFKPGGFTNGAGHGVTVKQTNGQYWHFILPLRRLMRTVFLRKRKLLKLNKIR